MLIWCYSTLPYWRIYKLHQHYFVMHVYDELSFLFSRYMAIVVVYTLYCFILDGRGGIITNSVSYVTMVGAFTR